MDSEIVPLINYDEKIGKGSYGEVFSGTMKIKGKVYIVAIKRIEQNAESMNEIKQLHKLRHTNIVHLYFAYEDEAMFVNMVMEKADMTLRTLLRQEELELPAVADIGLQILKGLDYIHSFNVMHRDMKPENVLVWQSSDLTSFKVKICDFGCATLCDQGSKNEGYIITRWYRPPELLHFVNDIRIDTTTFYGPEVDMWSVGCILGELYYGAPLFAGQTTEEQAKLTLPDGIHAALFTMVTNCPQLANVVGSMLRDPSNRCNASQAMKMPFFVRPTRKKFTYRVKKIARLPNHVSLGCNPAVRQRVVIV